MKKESFLDSWYEVQEGVRFQKYGLFPRNEIAEIKKLALSANKRVALLDYLAFPSWFIQFLLRLIVPLFSITLLLGLALTNPYFLGLPIVVFIFLYFFTIKRGTKSHDSPIDIFFSSALNAGYISALSYLCIFSIYDRQFNQFDFRGVTKLFDFVFVYFIHSSISMLSVLFFMFLFMALALLPVFIFVWVVAQIKQGKTTDLPKDYLMIGGFVWGLIVFSGLYIADYFNQDLLIFERFVNKDILFFSAVSKQVASYISDYLKFNDLIRYLLSGAVIVFGSAWYIGEHLKPDGYKFSKRPLFKYWARRMYNQHKKTGKSYDELLKKITAK